MKRSGGVVASAVVAILGCALVLLFGFFAAFMAITARLNPGAFPENQAGMPATPFSITAILLGEAVVFFALGVFGIIAAVGLLRLKNWARISFLVFAGLLCFFGVFGVLSSVLVMLLAPQFAQATPQVPAGFFRVMFGIFLVLYLAVSGLGVAWLAYFTRPPVKAQFFGGVHVAVPRRGPLSVRIIAWILAVSGGLSLLYLPFGVPATLFGMVFRGWAARGAFLLLGLTGLLAGIGMLRLRPRAHSLAIGFYIFGIVNTLTLLFLPGSLGRMNEILLEMVPQSPGNQALFTDMFARLGMIGGLIGGAIGSAVPLWFLVTRRRAFLDACETPPPPTVQA